MAGQVPNRSGGHRRDHPRKVPGATNIGMESGSAFPLAVACPEGDGPAGRLPACQACCPVPGAADEQDGQERWRGIAEYLQKGHCSVVNVKSLDSYRARALMGMRAQLVWMPPT